MKLKLLIIISLIVLAGMGWWATRRQQRVVFCDVGQGDGAIVIDGSWQMLVDTGPDNGRMVECLGKYLPFWDKEIEVVVVSHWDGDHSGGLKRVQQLYRIDETYGGSPPNSQIEHINYSGSLASGDTIRAREIQFVVNWPHVNLTQEISESNERSLVGSLHYKTLKILFTGDVTAEEEQLLVWRKLLTDKTDILKVSHHGSAEATSKELLEVVQPKTAIISVGKKNRFGHPTQKVLERLQETGVKIRRTDIEGDVVIDVSRY